MAEQENMEVIQELLEGWNTHDLERIVALVDEGAFWESDTLPEPVRGREAIQQGFQMYLTAFPDVHFNTEQMIASGDYVVGRMLITGTHQGELRGIQPTNRKVEFHDCIVWEVRNGKITYIQDYWNTATMLSQMGVLPSQ